MKRKKKETELSNLLGVEQGKRLLVTDGKTDKGRRAGARRSGDEAMRRRRTRRAGPHADARPGPGLTAPRGGQCPARGFQMNCRGTRTPGHPPHRGAPADLRAVKPGHQHTARGLWAENPKKSARCSGPAEGAAAFYVAPARRAVVGCRLQIPEPSKAGDAASPGDSSSSGM